MPETLSSELRYLAERTRRLLQDELRPLEESLDPDPNVAVPAEVRARVRELSRLAGLYTLTQPPELAAAAPDRSRYRGARDGGRGAPASRALGAGTRSRGSPPGGGELRRLYLEPVLRGERQGAFAFTEPHDAPAPTAPSATAATSSSTAGSPTSPAVRMRTFS